MATAHERRTILVLVAGAARAEACRGPEERKRKLTNESQPDRKGREKGRARDLLSAIDSRLLPARRFIERGKVFSRANIAQYTLWLSERRLGGGAPPSPALATTATTEATTTETNI